MKRYILSHVPIAVLYALIVAIFRGGFWPITAVWLLDQLWWIIGVLIGVLLVFLDRVAYVYSFPAEQLSQQVDWYFKNKAYGKALSLLDSRRYEQVKLTFRSALFMVAWVPLAFFALTSTSGYAGKGVVMGVMFHIIYDMWRLHKRSPEQLNIRLFWQIKRTISNEEQMVFMWVMTVVFVFFSWWAR